MQLVLYKKLNSNLVYIGLKVLRNLESGVAGNGAVSVGQTSDKKRAYLLSLFALL